MHNIIKATFKIKNIFALFMCCLISVLVLSNIAVAGYASGVFTTTGSLNYGRSGHSATLLSNGKVLIVGGSTYVYATELYDPASGTFSTTGSLIKSKDLQLRQP